MSRATSIKQILDHGIQKSSEQELSAVESDTLRFCRLIAEILIKEKSGVVLEPEQLSEYSDH